MDPGMNEPVLVPVVLQADDAERLLDALGERSHGESWSARCYVAVAQALGREVPAHIAREAA